MKRFILPLMAAVTAAIPFAGPHPRITLVFTDRGHTRPREMVPAMNGQRIYHFHDSTEIYLFDRKTRRDVLVMSGVAPRSAMAVSRASDRLAFTRVGDDHVSAYLWTVPLDPATGLVKGTSQRVSISRATDPAFSPDGRFIVFGAPNGPRPEEENLLVVPVNGGPEKTLSVTNGDIWPTRWLANGIYYGLSFNEKKDAPRNGIYRANPNGGAPAKILRTADWGGYPGPSDDARTFVAFDSTWDSVIVANGAGARIASYEPNEDEPTPDILVTSTHAMGWAFRQPRVVSVLNLASGATRTISDSTHDYMDPQWSPDGSTVLYNYNRVRVVLMRADGSGRPRVIRLEKPIANYNAVVWSPDGKSILYREVADSDAIRVIDVASGKTRQIVAHAGSEAPPRWRNDSRGILYVTATGSDADPIRKITVHEAMLSGGDRALGTVSSSCWTTPQCAKIANDSSLITWTQARERGPAIPYVVTNFRTGAAKALISVDSYGFGYPSASPEGEWIAIRCNARDGGRQSIELMRADGSGHVSLPVPFAMAQGPTHPVIARGGSELFVASNEPDASHAIYRVDVETGKSTMIARLPGKTPFSDIRIRADGNAVAYTAAQTPYVDYYDFDLSELVKGGKKK